MPSFYLRFEDVCQTMHKVAQQADEWDALTSSLRAFRMIGMHLELGAGDRFENLGKRLGFLQQQKLKTRRIDNLYAKRSQASSGPVTIGISKGHMSEEESQILSLIELPSIPIPQERTSGTCFDGQFNGLDPASLLIAPCEPLRKPVIQLSLDNYTKSLPPEDSGTNDDLTTIHDIRNDPNEIFIIPSAFPPTPTSLQSIAELSDEEEEQDTGTPRSVSPVYFVNPFGLPSRNAQLPSPPQTPSSMAECIPPHLNDDEEDEESLSRSEPINLTGRVKKLMDPPIALGGTSDIFYGEWRLPVPKRVAVKVLRTTNTNSVTTVQRRLRREMRLWWMCRHRNVVPLYGYASDFGGMDAMISPWMKNGSALTYIKAQKCSWAERLKMLGDIVAGLKYLHHFQPPIIHGDLKPTNVLISDNGDACLCDFGLSRIIKGETGSSGFTTSNFAGSIRYMSPELLNSEDEEALPLVTAESDVYALGCVALEIVTDQVPYANRNLDAQVMHDIIRGIPPARRPSLVHVAAVTAGGISGGKHSLPKFWDLLTATWAIEPSHRPDVVKVAHLLSECRTPRQGPQLRVERAATSASIGHSPAYRASTHVEPARSSLGAYPATPTGHMTTGGSFVQRSPSRTLSRASSFEQRGRLGSAFRLPTSGNSSVVDLPVSNGQKASINSPFTSTSALKRSLSAGSTPPRSLRSPSPLVQGSPASSAGSLPSETLHRLRRSTSAVLKGSLKRAQIRRNPSASFRPSVDATGQVWHDG